MATSLSHDWESASVRSWDPAGDINDGGEEGEPARATPSGEFASMLVLLYIESKISAQTVCLFSYYATKSMICGPANKFAAKPGKSSGDSAR